MLEKPAPPRKLFTAKDLERLPPDDRCEVIRGELCPMPDIEAMHGNITALITAYAGVFIEQEELGECFAAGTHFVLEVKPDTVVAADFAFVSKGRVKRIPSRGYLFLAPDLIVETHSDDDRSTEFALKIALWLNSGVKVVWAVEPKSQTVAIHRSGEMPQILTGDDTLTEEKLLPGFALPLKRLFRAV